jgi:hypothetical protein
LASGCFCFATKSESDGRLTGVPYEPTVQVYTAWDLGIRDSTAVWFAQVVGREIHLLDYYEASGVDLGHYVREIINRPYLYAGHIVPHDAQAKELGTGKSRLEVLESEQALTENMDTTPEQLWQRIVRENLRASDEEIEFLFISALFDDEDLRLQILERFINDIRKRLSN